MARRDQYKQANSWGNEAPPPSYREATAPPAPSHPSTVTAHDAVHAVAASAADRIPRICGCLVPSAAITFILILGFISMGLITALVMMSVLNKRDPNFVYVGGYIQTTCTTKKVKHLDYFQRELECGHVSYKYECWDITVDYVSRFGVWPSEDLKQYDEYTTCSVEPPCDPSESVRRAAVNNFVTQYGTVGRSFTCYYDDDGFSDRPFVVSPKDKTDPRIVQYAIPSVFLVLCFAGIFALCWSGGGPAGVCSKCKQQREVQQEAADDLIALGHAVRRGNRIVIAQNV